MFRSSKLFILLRFLLQAYRAYKRSELLQLAEKVRTDKSFFSHNYIRVYEKIFKERRTQIKSLLEVGLLQHSIQHKEKKSSYVETPSLWLWNQYFPNAEIFGFDLKHFKNAGNDRMHTIQGDQSSRQDLKKITDIRYEFDVIIDDALHASQHQQITFSYLFPFLKPGGVYIIEDLHFQPDLYEEKGVSKTRELLEYLNVHKEWNSTYATDCEKKTIEQSVDLVEFYDTCKRNVRHGGRDAFAVVYKK